MTARIAILGTFVADATFRTARLPRMGETVFGESAALSPGGKGSNQALAAARLGAEVVLISRLGHDALAEMALSAWAEAGVTPLVSRSHGAATGIASVMVDTATGENAIVVHPGAALELSEVDVDSAADAIRSASVFLTQLEQPLPAAMRGLEIARRAGVTTVLNPAPYAEIPTAMLALCDYLTPNETEAELLTGIPVGTDDGARRAAAVLRGRGAGVAAITLGARGALYHGPDTTFLASAFRAGRTVETTGAGDAFNGAFAVALAEGLEPGRAVCFACAAAGLSVTRAGAARSMPVRAEVEALLAAR
ncbi:MAG: ribokinase [Rhodospirillaceae bacterium]|nr:ribokinase [Rhodospirillaceae bacterium]MYH38098.1 ribokinase [Rhodospirillaceae bacterium]MYK15400.1 ribokinase [Rhodospirillaceae bacterium]MYK59622.1 ribokinase [Rhodospirillaceae bacterium]